MSLDDYVIIGPLCYRGKEGCTSGRCTRSYSPEATGCFGYHCSYCDEPCSSQGHHCPTSEAILGEAERVAREEGRIR